LDRRCSNYGICVHGDATADSDKNVFAIDEAMIDHAVDSLRGIA
jgi:hypothetical protein